MKMMKAVVYTALGRANGSVTEIPYPVCGENEVIIKVMSAGICKAADSLIDSTGTPLDVFPVVPGHEFAGVVEEVGNSVVQFKPGDRVTADNTVPCGDCYYCRRNLPSLCSHFGSLGHNINGGAAQFVKVQADKVFRLPDNVSFDAGSVTEPVACAMQALDKMQVQYGDNVLILGAGPHGMILSMLLHTAGAAHAVCIAPTQWKLDRLAERGIETLRMDRDDYSIHERAVLERFPQGVDKIIDTTGSGPMLASAIRMLRNGGSVYLYSNAHRPDDYFKHVDADAVYFRELSIIPTGLQTHKYGRCLEAMALGAVDTEMLVTHHYSLDDYFEALDYNNLHGHDVLKVVLHPNKA